MRIYLIALLMMSASSLLAKAEPISKEAQSTISKVHIAASKNDITALKKLMVKEFIWSFGGDSDAEQAIQAWRADPSLLHKLYDVTGQYCAEAPDHSIECPKNAGTGYRAGFKKTAVGWRMFYFVGGD